MKIFNNLFLIFCLSVSFVNAQTILVNNNVISVQNDVTFPLWLDSMSTIGIGTQVVSISALEFNIVTANNGNSLVFSQTKTITSQETVPNGMTWKITAVLLDSTTLNNSSSNGSGQVIVSGGGASTIVALSQESVNEMIYTDALLYCDSLIEGGKDDWVLPTFEQLSFATSGGLPVPGLRTKNFLWTASWAGDYDDEMICLKLNIENNNINNNFWAVDARSASGITWEHVRCVRHESISISSSGSPSGGSNSASTLGNNMPTMLSNESANTMFFYEAMIYCDSLNEFGYSDWVLPNFDQLSYAISGGCVIQDERSQEYIWSRSYIEYTGSEYLKTIKTSGTYTLEKSGTNTPNKCRCVR